MTHLTGFQRLKYAGLMQRKYGNCIVNVWMSPGHYYFSQPVMINILSQALDNVFRQPYLRNNLNDVDVVLLYSFKYAIGKDVDSMAFIKGADLFKQKNILFIHLNMVRQDKSSLVRFTRHIMNIPLSEKAFQNQLEDTLAHEMAHLAQNHLTNAASLKYERQKKIRMIFFKSASEGPVIANDYFSDVMDFPAEKMNAEQVILSIFIKAYDIFTAVEQATCSEGMASFMGTYAAGRYNPEKATITQGTGLAYAKREKGRFDSFKEYIAEINQHLLETVNKRMKIDGCFLGIIAKIKGLKFSIDPYYEIGEAICETLFRLGKMNVEQIGSMNNHKLINEYTRVCLENNIKPLITDRPRTDAVINLSDIRDSLHKLRKEILQNIKQLKSQQGKWH